MVKTKTSDVLERNDNGVSVVEEVNDIDLGLGDYNDKDYIIKKCLEKIEDFICEEYEQGHFGGTFDISRANQKYFLPFTDDIMEILRGLGYEVEFDYHSVPMKDAYHSSIINRRLDPKMVYTLIINWRNVQPIIRRLIKMSDTETSFTIADAQKLKDQSTQSCGKNYDEIINAIRNAAASNLTCCDVGNISKDEVMLFYNKLMEGGFDIRISQHVPGKFELHISWDEKGLNGREINGVDTIFKLFKDYIDESAERLSALKRNIGVVISSTEKVTSEKAMHDLLNKWMPKL